MRSKKQFLLYFYTLRHLRPIQLRYRLFYLLRNKWRRLIRYRVNPVRKLPPTQRLRFQAFLIPEQSFTSPTSFQFLNQTHDFQKEIDWNYSSLGKLWTYNLNYFDFLGQSNLSPDEGFRLIRDFNRYLPHIKDGLEPYPTSLRVINWIKFLSRHELEDPAEAVRSLLAQCLHLKKYREFHLMGNHLLENGFALLFGACYFKRHDLLRSATAILKTELKEQILKDGGHFERSPMYHQILLYRLLDSINLLQNNQSFGQAILPLLKERAAIMLGWLNTLTFRNGSIPMLNDATAGIAPTTLSLRDYARRLGLASEFKGFSHSGYRKWATPDFELVMDIGEVGPSYIPGHAHSDTLSFVLQVSGYPFVVDPGISTYEKNTLRQQQRSTSSHNTVMVADVEQSEVWGGFRVARRAKPMNVVERADYLAASHTGYLQHEVEHRRSFQFIDQHIKITDQVKGKSTWERKAFIHFHPSVQVKRMGNNIHTNLGVMRFEEVDTVEIVDYQYAQGFNQLVPSKKLVLHFQNSLHTHIFPQTR